MHVTSEILIGNHLLCSSLKMEACKGHWARKLTVMRMSLRSWSRISLMRKPVKRPAKSWFARFYLTHSFWTCFIEILCLLCSSRPSSYRRRKDSKGSGKLAPIITNTTLNVCRLFGELACISRLQSPLIWHVNSLVILRSLHPDDDSVETHCFWCHHLHVSALWFLPVLSEYFLLYSHCPLIVF